MKAKDFPLRRYSSQLQTPNGRRQSVFAKAGPVFLNPIPSTGTKGGVLCSSRKNNAFICFAALVSWFLLIDFSVRTGNNFLYQRHYCTTLSLDAKGYFLKASQFVEMSWGIWMVRNHRIFRGGDVCEGVVPLICVLMVKVFCHY